MYETLLPHLFHAEVESSSKGRERFCSVELSTTCQVFYYSSVLSFSVYDHFCHTNNNEQLLSVDIICKLRFYGTSYESYYAFFKVHTLIFKNTFPSNDALQQQEGKQHQVTDTMLFHSTFTPVVQHQTTTLVKAVLQTTLITVELYFLCITTLNYIKHQPAPPSGQTMTGLEPDVKIEALFWVVNTERSETLSVNLHYSGGCSFLTQVLKEFHLSQFDASPACETVD